MAVLQGISVRNGFQAVIYAVLGAAAFGGCVKELEQATAADHNVYLVLEDAGDPACTTDARVAWVLVWDTGLADDGPAYTTVALLPQGPGKPSDPTVEGFDPLATIAVPNTDSGVFLRGQHKSQVNIWCWPVGSGEVWGYRTDARFSAEVHAGATPKKKADRPVGEWNTFHIVMKGDRLTVTLNGVEIITQAQLPGVPEKGPLALQLHPERKDGEWGASLVQFRNIRIKEL